MAYGRDTYCTDGVKSGRLVSGAILLAQALYRRLITVRGSLRGGEAEENYGFDIVGLIGANHTEGDKAALPSKIRNELLKDGRVEDVTVEVVASDTGANGIVEDVTVEVVASDTGANGIAYTITIDVVPFEEIEEFTFSVAVTKVNAAFLGLTSAT